MYLKEKQYKIVMILLCPVQGPWASSVFEPITLNEGHARFFVQASLSCERFKRDSKPEPTASHTKMKSGLYYGSQCLAHGLPSEEVDSSVDMSCQLLMLTYIISAHKLSTSL